MSQKTNNLIISLLIGVALLFFINPVYAAVGNGGFETGLPSSWIVGPGVGQGEYSIHADYAHSGNYGCQLTITPGKRIYFYQNVDLTGKNYLSFWLKAVNLPGNSEFKVKIDGTWRYYKTSSSSTYTQIFIDVSEQTGSDQVIFELWNGTGEIWIDEWSTDIEPSIETDISFYPDIETDDVPPEQIKYFVNSDDVSDGAFWHLYRSIDTHDIPWWDDEHTTIGPTLIDMGYCWDGDYNYIYDEEITVNIDTEDYYDYNCTYEVILYGFYIPGQLASDSFYYYIDITENPEPTPEPTPNPTPSPTPSATPTPGPTATPQPDPEPINESLNTSFKDGYHTLVDGTVDGFFVPVYNFTDYIAQPLTGLNQTLCNFTVLMNESFNTTSVSLGISTSLLFTIMSGFPQKIINVFAYYLIWVIILIIFKGET